MRRRDPERRQRVRKGPYIHENPRSTLSLQSALRREPPLHCRRTLSRSRQKCRLGPMKRLLLLGEHIALHSSLRSFTQMDAKAWHWSSHYQTTTHLTKTSQARSPLSGLQSNRGRIEAALSKPQLPSSNDLSSLDYITRSD